MAKFSYNVIVFSLFTVCVNLSTLIKVFGGQRRNKRFYSRANLSISGDRCRVTATNPTHRINMKLAITPITKLMPRDWTSSRLKQ